ncbi:diguanylate cyclase [Brevundimonas sp. Leaf363]|nr:diguanylate cyclase [Brevundimonas sp. Leaf363]
MGTGFDQTESATRMRAWDALKRPIWLFDPINLTGVYANAPALALWGARTLEDLLARDFSQLSEAVKARTDRLAKVTANGEEVYERWTFYPNGQPVTVQALISTYRLEDGRPVLMFEAAPADVDAEERRAAEALRHTSTLITLFDAEGAPVFCNPAAFAAYGSPSHPFEARFARPELSQPILKRALGGQVASELVEAVTVHGRRWHNMDARPVTDPVTGALGVLLNERDVTERVEAQQAQVAAEREAAVARAREHFLTEMSHELRTPLNAVLGFSELLQGSDLPGAATSQAARIHAAGQRLLTVVNQMIDRNEGDLPTVAAPCPAVPAVAMPEAAAGAVRVLYVDDNDSNRLLVTTILGSQGVVCETAEDGAQGLEAAAGADWDLILMDIQMPVMDGVEATRAIRALPGLRGCVPIVAVTANTLGAQRDLYASVGMNDCLAKPVNIAQLMETVAVWAITDPNAGAVAA